MNSLLPLRATFAPAGQGLCEGCVVILAFCRQLMLPLVVSIQVLRAGVAKLASRNRFGTAVEMVDLTPLSLRQAGLLRLRQKVGMGTGKAMKRARARFVVVSAKDVGASGALAVMRGMPASCLALLRQRESLTFLQPLIIELPSYAPVPIDRRALSRGLHVHSGRAGFQDLP